MLTLSSTSSMEKSFPSPLELLHVRMALLLVTRALTVHLKKTTHSYELCTTQCDIQKVKNPRKREVDVKFKLTLTGKD